MGLGVKIERIFWDFECRRNVGCSIDRAVRGKNFKVAHRLCRPTGMKRNVLVVHCCARTNSERVPHVRTSVRGLRKLRRPGFPARGTVRSRLCGFHFKESRMKIREANKVDRKSGGSPSKVRLFSSFRNQRALPAHGRGANRGCFSQERRMRIREPTRLHRKSGMRGTRLWF